MNSDGKYIFKEGDLVRITEDRPDCNRDIHLGDIAKIVIVRKDGSQTYKYGLEFDHDINGHELDGKNGVEKNCGWWVSYQQIEPLEDLDPCSSDELVYFLSV